jgi:hypothetical protein
MKYLYWVFLGILVIAGITVSLYFGIQPKPVPKIKPSQVDSPEVLGEAIGKRLWLEMKDTPLIFLGVDPEKPDHMKVWKGLFESLDKNLEYAVVVDPNLRHKVIVNSQTELDMNTGYAEFVEWLKAAMEHNQRVAIVVPTIYSSQAIPDNPINRLKKEMANPSVMMTLSIVEPTLSREEESRASYPCVTGSGDVHGIGSFGCMIQGKSRSLYLKKFESGRYLGLMDQIGGTDYLVLLRFIP